MKKLEKIRELKHEMEKVYWDHDYSSLESRVNMLCKVVPEILDVLEREFEEREHSHS